MAIKKTELYNSLWKSCDDLRGPMDPSQYKNYILTLLFVKYVSDKYSNQPHAIIEIPKGGSFQDMIAIKGNPDIGNKMNIIIRKLAEANNLGGVFDEADFNNEEKLGKGKEMQDRISSLISIFENPELNFGKNRAEGDDILGDAYEYLMRHFATDSGKSKGQFYTPAEVSKTMAKVIGINEAKRKDQTVYDPTCGSGSLLLKTADETEHGVTIYGQENETATRGLAKMNMVLHNQPDAEIVQGNTLSAPRFKNPDGALKTFDFVVANPPFSSKSWTTGLDPKNDVFGRFEGYGIPPTKNGDYAFLLHLIKSLKSNGKGAIILPHGVLFRGNAEAEIRKNIIKRGYIKGIISLPPNLFYGTGIPACIIVIDKENAQNRKGIFMIDASKGFAKDGNKNRLRDRDIHKIVDVFNKQLQEPKYSRMVDISEISDPKNDFNLNIPRYIDSQEEEDVHDIEAHLKGGIPDNDVQALEEYWKVCPALQKKLFGPSQRAGYSTLKIEQDKIKSTIFNHDEFKQFLQKTESHFEKWKSNNYSILKNIKINSRPKEIVRDLSEDLLSTFTKVELIDRYEIYQQFMSYWEETMKDDIYYLSEEGWKAEITTLRGKKDRITGWDCDLIPKKIVIGKYFAKEQIELDDLQSKLDDLNIQMETLVEENAGENDLFEEVKNDSGKVSRSDLLKRIREIKGSNDFADEFSVLNKYSILLEKESETKNKVKTNEIELDKKLLARYKSLSENETMDLVINDKWMVALHDAVNSEVDHISQKLTSRIKILSERYAEPLPALEKEVEEYSKKVESHLKGMGFKW